MRKCQWVPEPGCYELFRIAEFWSGLVSLPPGPNERLKLLSATGLYEVTLQKARKVNSMDMGCFVLVRRGT